MAVEDEEIFRLIDEAATSGPNNVTISTSGLTRAALTQAFADIRTWGRDEFDPVEVTLM